MTGRPTAAELPRFRVRRGDRRRNWFGLVDRDGEELFYGGWRRIQRLASFLNEWDPTEEQLARFLAWSSADGRHYVSGLPRITLRWQAVCARCDQPIDVGARASWDPETGVILHGLRCPLKTVATTTPDAPR